MNISVQNTALVLAVPAWGCSVVAKPVLAADGARLSTLDARNGLGKLALTERN